MQDSPEAGNLAGAGRMAGAAGGPGTGGSEGRPEPAGLAAAADLRDTAGGADAAGHGDARGTVDAGDVVSPAAAGHDAGQLAAGQTGPDQTGAGHDAGRLAAGQAGAGDVAGQADAGRFGDAAPLAEGWLVRGIGPTPALRGFPGETGLPEPGGADARPGSGTGAAGPGAAGRGAAGPGAGPAAAGAVPMSPWQRSGQVWRAAAIDWVREPGWLPEQAWPDAAREYWVAGPEKTNPAERDWDHTEPIPVVPPMGIAGRVGRVRAGRPAPRPPATARHFRGLRSRDRAQRAEDPAQRGQPPAPGGIAPGRAGRNRFGAAAGDRGEPGRAGGRIAPGVPGRIRRPAGRVAAIAVSGAVIVLAVAITVTLARQPARVPAQAKPLPGYPAARLADTIFPAGGQPAGGQPAGGQPAGGQPAGGQFAGGQPGAALLPSLSTLAGSGTTVIAAGARAGLAGPQPVILVSTDGGNSWRPATLRAPGGDVSGGTVPYLLAGGAGGWLALAPQATWTSADGQIWHREPGIALHPGDRVLGLARTSAGFLAVGMNTPAGGPSRATGILWTSANGATWQRTTASQAGLMIRGGLVGAVEQVAARGAAVLVTAGLAPASARSHTAPVPPAVLAWRSTDGGLSWAPVRLPGGHGAAAVISGVAADSAGFTLVRPGQGRPDALAYQSADGARWRLASVLTGANNRALKVVGLSGDDNGAVLAATESAGRGGPGEVAFVTGPGLAWHRILLLGSGAGGTLAGAAAGPGGAVVAAGSALTSPPPAAGQRPVPPVRRPFLLLAGPRYAFTGQQALASVASSGLTVTGLASGGGREVAIGSAGGRALIWAGRPGGRWSAARPGTWAMPGLTLSGVSYGDGQWLVLGRASSHGRSRPVLLTSPDGRDWQVIPGPGRLAGNGAVISQVVAGQSGYVLVGQRLAGRRPAAAAWWSAAPGAWSQASVGQAPVRPAGAPASAAVPAATTAAAAPAAAGRAGKTPAAGRAVKTPAAGRAVKTPPARPAAHRHPRPPAPPPSGMLAATTGGPGFVAVGGSGSGPAVWSSVDGRVWNASVLAQPAGARSAVLQRVAADGARIAAVGTETTAAGTVPFAAVSADAGRNWREFALPLPACGPAPVTAAAAPAAVQAGVTSIVAAAGGFVATGTCGPAGQLNVVVWSSPDGRTWTAAAPPRPGLGGPGAQQITSLAVDGRYLTGVGYTATLAGDHPTFWRAPLG